MPVRVVTRTRGLLVCLPTMVVATYPLSKVIEANGGLVPLDPWVLGRSYLATVIATTALLMLARLVQRDLTTRALWLGWILAFFVTYAFIVVGLQALGARVEAHSAGTAILYVASTVTLVTLLFRPWQLRSRSAAPLTIVSVGVVLLNLSFAGFSILKGRDGPWRGAADALIQSALAAGTPNPAKPLRDIYYVILDGFGRGDVLQTHYGVDLGRHVAFLRSKGFYVPAGARSNYAQTYLSLASTLNMNYLDQLAGTMGDQAYDRRPLQYLIDHNALMQAARRSGYRITGIGSGYMATLHIKQADTCICDRIGMDDIERAAIDLTPLAALPITDWRAAAHRRKILESFSAVEQAAAGQGPTLVFAHIVAPHPPFLFGPDGSPRPLMVARATFGDGDDFPGSREEYRQGYRDQVQFVATRLTRLVELLLSRPGPTPVIIVHGDHGPGSKLHWDDPLATDMTERMAIFAAYLFPDEAPLYPEITPVNAARMLANRYFASDLPPLPDRSWFSTEGQPYRFIGVP
jgi:hypothetical protein